LYVFPACASLSNAAPAGVAGYAIVPVSRAPAASRALRPGRVMGLGLAADYRGWSGLHGWPGVSQSRMPSPNTGRRGGLRSRRPSGT